MTDSKWQYFMECRLHIRYGGGIAWVFQPMVKEAYLLEGKCHVRFKHVKGHYSFERRNS